MNLGFRTHINDKPTYFPEKIWGSILQENLITHQQFDEWTKKEKNKKAKTFEEALLFFNKTYLNPKPHSIREDKKGRWKEGNDIHMVIGNRTKSRRQFSPVIKCRSVQNIHIHRGIRPLGGLYSTVRIDNRVIYGIEIYELAKNDGFNSVECFFNYFGKDFSGKLIHWTDKKY